MAIRKRVLLKSRGRARKTAAPRRKVSGGDGIGSTLPALQFPVVAMGASAGGLAAFTSLLKALPAKSGMAFVLIQHLAPKHESALSSLLAKATLMPVVEVSDGIRVEPNCVYVIPPNKYMTIRKGTLRLVPRSPIAGAQRPIDEFAVALAEEQGAGAIGVVLSGTGSDGTYGLKAIRTAGGVTFAQDPKSAQWPGMPISAIAAGAVDFVLTPRRIAAELARIGRHPYLAATSGVPEGSDLDKVCLSLRSMTGVDFRLYKQATVRRRIARRMALQRVASLGKYAQLLKRSPGEAQLLADDIFIHVTSFFRDPECYQALRKLALAKLCRKRASGDPLRIWVAGCSTGEEAYSIAILALEELGERAGRTTIQIFGTDIQEHAINKARAGIYTETAVAGLSQARLKRFFFKEDSGYRIRKFVRDLCVFARHDLARDPPFSRLDLVSCRNALIYMGAALQKRVLSTFQYALKPGGFLFLGNSESISDYSDTFTAVDRTHRIFLRKASSASFRDFGAIRDPGRAPDASAPALALDLRREAETILLEQYTPPAVVVDPDLHIVHFQGDTSPYLAPATGQPSFHLLKMVRPELAGELRAAIQKARRDNIAVHKDAVRFKDEPSGRSTLVHLEVRPLRRRDGRKKDLLVVFRRVDETDLQAALDAERERPSAGTGGKRADQKTARLERELISTRENLIALISDHEHAQEEMKAANEEILSSSEELQSTNEELETAKEELQSSNEELITLNEELQSRNGELNVLAQDLTNLLLGVDVAVLVLDAGLRVRRFTPVAGTLLNLIPGDVGRPFSNIASNLAVSNWKELFSRVTDQGQSVQREVSDRTGHRYSLRMRPYKSSGNAIDGVLVVLFDIDTIRKSLDEARRSRDVAAEAEKRADSILNSLTAHVCVLGPDGTIVATNEAWDRFARKNGGSHLKAAGVGANYLEVCRRAELKGLPEAESARDGIEAVLEGRSSFFQLEYPCHSDTEQRWFFMNVSPLEGAKGGAVIAHTNTTERKQAQIQLEKSAATIGALLESSTQSIIAVDANETIVIANGNTEKMFGYRREELLGQSLEILIPEMLRGRHAAHHRAYFADMQTRPMGIGRELEGRRKDGSIFPVEIGLSGMETHDGRLAVAFVSDITERKRMETALRQREQEVSAVLDDTPDVIMRLNREFRYTYVNAKTASVAGLPREAFLGKTSEELGLPADLIAVWKPAMASAFKTGKTGTLGFSYPSPDGPTQWEERFIPEFAPDGSAESVLIIGHDVTERARLERLAEANRAEVRALAASLLTAQEEERRRVSRELHDQICQELASLAFDIGGLVAKPPRQAEARDRLKVLQARVVKASEDTRHIAYELHPSVLDDLGLETSLRELCKRFSERAGGDVALEFKSAALPASLPREVASCLYRVAQESLTNLARHSGAKHASVALTVKDGTIRLEIADNGAGFDPEAVKGQGGLGLISMEERTRLVHGKLSIETAPGHGTRIAVEVPLAADSL